MIEIMRKNGTIDDWGEIASWGEASRYLHFSRRVSHALSPTSCLIGWSTQ